MLTFTRVFCLSSMFISSVALCTTAVVHLTDENYQEIVSKASKPLILDVYASWCGPCKAFKPVFEKFAQDNADSYICADLNYDDSKTTALALHVTNLPTLIIVDGNREIGRMIGAVSQEALPGKIKELLQNKDKKISELPKEVQIERFKAALETSCLEDIKTLLEAGIDVNAPIKSQQPLVITISTALASDEGLEALKLLLAHGASQKNLTIPGYASPTDAINVVREVKVNFEKMVAQVDKVIAALEADLAVKAKDTKKDTTKKARA